MSSLGHPYTHPAYREGYAAFRALLMGGRAGRARSDCPYTGGARLLWKDGWMDARGEERDREIDAYFARERALTTGTRAPI